jgi:C_GCAxxG_C_C family probable redox protein
MSNTDDKELALEAAETAAQLERDCGGCPQCVLVAVQETAGGIDDAIVKAMHGLSGGGALLGEGLCGALAAGLVALSLRHGRERDQMSKGRFLANFERGRDLLEAFRAEFGGVTCRELQKSFCGRTYDLWDAAQFKEFKQARGDKCANATAWVARRLVETAPR